MWNLRRSDTNELTYKIGKRLTDLENELMVEGEGIVRDFGNIMNTLLYLNWITSKDLLYSTWNSAQCCVAAWVGGEFGGEETHVYVWPSPLLST